MSNLKAFINACVTCGVGVGFSEYYGLETTAFAFGICMALFGLMVFFESLTQK